MTAGILTTANANWWAFIAKKAARGESESNVKEGNQWKLRPPDYIRRGSELEGIFFTDPLFNVLGFFIIQLLPQYYFCLRFYKCLVGVCCYNLEEIIIAKLVIIHSKSEKVCGTAFSIKKYCRKVRVIFVPFWVIFGPFRGIFGKICVNFNFFAALLGRWGRRTGF